MRTFSSIHFYENFLGHFFFPAGNQKKNIGTVLIRMIVIGSMCTFYKTMKAMMYKGTSKDKPMKLYLVMLLV